jgi:predicted GNAT superfamily acetyltransferase
MTAPLPIAPDDQPAVLALNNAHAVELSPLDAGALARLIDQSFHARRVGTLDGFLIAFDQGADYDSPNFLWFRARYPRFVYVDRVVIAPAARGRGLARRLYEDLFRRSADAGHTQIACEVNSKPPNPISDEFHGAMGFAAVGLATLERTGKTVRYLLRPL